jgi:hypothetical protein
MARINWTNLRSRDLGRAGEQMEQIPSRTRPQRKEKPRIPRPSHPASRRASSVRVYTEEERAAWLVQNGPIEPFKPDARALRAMRRIEQFKRGY